MPLTPGTRLGAYEVIGRLGAGAMGEVYRARDTRLGRDIALKILPAEFATNPDRRRRFEVESRSASALNHPNIVAVYDAGEEQGVSYIVSELVEGESLRDVIARGPLPLRKALDLAAQLADGLAAAHALGVVHRDMKPENVMLTREGRAKILDFGLARYQEPLTSAAQGTATMTQAGMIMGTVGYMSPEQVTGTPADARSDIFSLGIILYEMLTGKVVFECATTVETMTAILRSDVPELPATIPQTLQQIVQHCLEKEPSRRFQSAKDLAFSLHSFSGSISGTVSAPQLAFKKTRRMLPLVTAVLGILLVYSLAALLLRPPGADLGSYRFTPFATESEQQGTPAWSPDGKNVAYQRIVNNASNVILVRGVDSLVPNPIAKVGSTNDLFWSADSSRVYFVGDGGVWSVSRGGGSRQQVVKGPYESASLSPDGQSMVLWFGSDNSDQEKAKIWISSPPGAVPREYQPVLFKMNGTFSPVYLRFSPDGRKILLSLFRGKNGAEMWILPFPDGPTAQGKPRRIFAPALRIAVAASVSWMPDSQHIVMSFSNSAAATSRLWMADTDKQTMEPVMVDEGGKVDPSVSPEGKRILYVSGRFDFDVVELSLSGGDTVHPLVATNRAELFPAWSPAGNQFAYVTDRNGPPEIWMKSAKEGWERPLVTQHDFPDDDPTQVFLTPAFSPDGSRLAYSRNSAKHFGALWISPVGGGSPIRVTNSNDYEAGPSWSPDGNWIAYFSSEGGIMKIRVGANEPPVLLYSNGCENPPQWSPDGQWIACAGETGVALITPEGKISRTVGNRRAFVSWSRDGNEIYALGRDSDGHWRLGAIDVKSGKERMISDYGSQITFGSYFNPSFPLSLSPDGKSLATSLYHARSEIWMLEGFRLPGGSLSRLWPFGRP